MNPNNLCNFVPQILQTCFEMSCDLADFSLEESLSVKPLRRKELNVEFNNHNR